MLHRVVLLSLLLGGCSSGSSGSGSTTGPAPAGTLACMTTDQSSTMCACAAASSTSGACSPQALGAPAHCCATVTSGATTQCNCELDGNRCITDGSPTCMCTNDQNAFISLRGDTTVASCPKPSGGHCCQSTVHAMCSCGMDACQGEVEVDSCTLAETVMSCLAPAIAVTSCQ